jgi:putative hydrolase of the HAD superfamily
MLFDFNKIKNIVFDLGGVLITLDIAESINRYKKIGLTDINKLLDPYHQSGLFLELEEGKISKSEFYDEVRKLTSPNNSDDDILYAMLGFVKDIPIYKFEVIEKLKAKGFNIYLLSNTNPVLMDWAFRQDFFGNGKNIKEYFDKMYMSYLIGVCKPDRKIYDFMLNDTNMVPAETLFIDDGEKNVETGKQIGFQTYLAYNGEDFSHIFNF